MQIYLVGGYVRDKLLKAAGFPVEPSDRDWVVVGSTPAEMIAAKFLPVGKDFPVFLHPKTHEEYALARTERKTGRGYHGFAFYAAPDVTLEEDLRRRDLTINAIAEDQNGKLIDPYGGVADLTAGILRHVSNAFAEDPVRILRVARFSARYPTFSIAPQTALLMKEMVSSGEADALVAERIWAEFSKGLLSTAPLRMVEVLKNCGLWEKLFPNLPSVQQLARAQSQPYWQTLGLEERVALLLADAPKRSDVSNMLHALRAPVLVTQFAELFHEVLRKTVDFSNVEHLCTLFMQTDALRRPKRFEQLCSLMTHVTASEQWKCQQLFAAWRDIDARSVASAQTNPKLIASAILATRKAALSEALQKIAKTDVQQS